MKTWTVVVEIKDSEIHPGSWNAEDIKELVIPGYYHAMPNDITMQVFECTEAPYGPQGVMLKDAKP